jgi:hypothetical protein
LFGALLPTVHVEALAGGRPMLMTGMIAFTGSWGLPHRGDLALFDGRLLSLMLTWWFRPIDLVNMNRLTPAVFGERGIAPAGYAAFAFALGVTAGVLIRRTLPAMAVALAAFAATRLAITYWVRPRLITPAQVTGKVVESLPGGGLRLWPAAGPGGQVVHPVFRAACQRSLSAMRACHAQYHQVVSYQPASRFWAFQWRETAIFVALALILAGLSSWWLRRRLS